MSVRVSPSLTYTCSVVYSNSAYKYVDVSYYT